jgi:hypothetical protein
LKYAEAIAAAIGGTAALLANGLAVSAGEREREARAEERRCSGPCRTVLTLLTDARVTR